MSYILSLDQGTTSSRAILFDTRGTVVGVEQNEFDQIYPKAAWVEHNPQSIWASQIKAAKDVIKNCNLSSKDISAIGITNQRETTVVWDRKTGEPIYNAIVWQDRRTSKLCDELKEAGHAKTIKEKTGLVIDSYFSATKIKWILDNVDGARKKAEAGQLCVGTVDSWLVWKLTKGELHITDVSNASRTMLFNINSLEWDQELLDLFGIPKEILPQVRGSSEMYGKTTAFDSEITIASIIGDQQSALFGQLCIKPGMAKNTYGTGGFLMMNTGQEIKQSSNNLLSTIAWKIDEEITYALEGSVFIAGAVVQWLRDELGIISSSHEVEALANTVEDNAGVYFVPAFAGLGAPYWDQDARGTIVGLTRGTGKAHIARAALESIAYQSADVIKAMEADLGNKLLELRVDGGASINDLLMQFQADILSSSIVRPSVVETTALGAAYLAGLAVGVWDKPESLSKAYNIERTFEAKLEESRKNQLLSAWQEAVKRSQNWA